MWKPKRCFRLQTPSNMFFDSFRPDHRRIAHSNPTCPTQRRSPWRWARARRWSSSPTRRESGPPRAGTPSCPSRDSSKRGTSEGETVAFFRRWVLEFPGGAKCPVDPFCVCKPLFCWSSRWNQRTATLTLDDMLTTKKVWRGPAVESRNSWSWPSSAARESVGFTMGSLTMAGREKFFCWIVQLLKCSI